MLYEISNNVVEVIPYKSFKEKINIVLEELMKNRYVEVWDKFIYRVRNGGEA